MCNHLKLRKVDPTPINTTERCPNTMNLKPWLDKCRNLYNQVYKNGVNFFDYVSPDSVIERRLHKWFDQEVRVTNKVKYALIGSYSAKNHKLFEEGQRYLTEKKHILIFSFGDDCLYYFRQTNAITNEDIKEEAGHLTREIDSFKELHTDILSSAVMSIYGTLILPHETKEAVKEISGNLSLLDEKILEQPDTFQTWLETFEQDNYEKKDLDELFADMLSRILGFLSNLFREIPHIYDDLFTMIKKLPLTKQQQSIVDSDELRHVILNGSYGTGKTLVLQKKISRIVANSTEAISIYVILPDSASMLYGHTKKFLNELMINSGKNIKMESCREVLYPEQDKDDGHYDIRLCLMTFKEYFSLKDSDSSNNINEVLEGIVKDKKNVHIFIDEFNAERLTEDSAKKLSSLIKSELKDYTLYIVSQPLQVHRSIDQTSNSQSEGYCFKETNMNVENLEKAMRNPQYIHRLFKVAGEVIQEFKSEYKSKDFETKALKDIEDRPEKIVKKTGDREEEEEKAHEEDRNTKPGLNASFNEGDINTDLPLESFFHITSHLVNVSNSKKVINTYHIVSTSNCGHSLIGVKPTCYILSKIDEISNQTACHLELALLDAKAHRNGSVVICSSKLSSHMCVQVLKKKCNGKIKIHLPCLKRDEESDAVDCYQRLENGVTITDFLGVRGMELKNVIVVLSTDDYFLAPFFLETFTRVTGQLSIVLLNFAFKNTTKSIAIELVDRWYEKGLIKKVVYSCEESKVSYDSCADFEVRECIKSRKDHECFDIKGQKSEEFDQSDIRVIQTFLEQER